MDSSTKSKTVDDYQGEIFQLYIVQKKTLENVIATLKQHHGFSPSPKVLKTKLARWGYTKNIKRSEAKEILHEKSRRELVGKDYVFTLRRRPVNLEKVERHGQRARLQNVHQGYSSQPIQSEGRAVACRTPPPPLSQSLPVIEHWRVSEKLLHDVDVLIKGSFEGGRWSFNGNDLIINSSTFQVAEVKSLHSFLGSLDNGCNAADSNNFALAGTYWKQAFEDVEVLVKGQYHDIIPNIIQKINDINRNGRGELAELLKKHISNCSDAFLLTDGSCSSVYQGLGQLEMTSMVEIEERIMKRFHELFELYLGLSCYNSFVMMMNAARRRLLYDNWVMFEECLPALAQVDSVFGPTDRRSLDIIALRAETLFRRGLHNQTEAEGSDLVDRARMVRNDDWQRFYNLTRGCYFIGCAQYNLKKRDAAIENLSKALQYEEEFCKVDNFGIFVAERTTITKYLQDMKGADWETETCLGIS